jgi:hypothetical protein
MARPAALNIAPPQIWNSVDLNLGRAVPYGPLDRSRSRLDLIVFGQARRLA